MTIEKINPVKLPKPMDNMYTHIVRASGKYTYRLSGLVELGADGNILYEGDMAAQIRGCYQQVTWALESVGLSWSDVVHLYTFTTDMQEYLKYELPIAKQFFGEDPPASTLVQVSQLVDPSWLVEIQVDAIADH